MALVVRRPAAITATKATSPSSKLFPRAAAHSESPETRAARNEARTLVEDAGIMESQQDFDRARTKYEEALKIDPGSIKALDGLDRVRMQTRSARGRRTQQDAATFANMAVEQTQLAAKMMKLWKPGTAEDVADKAAMKLLQKVRTGRRPPPPVSSSSGWCGCESLAGCISARRLQRSVDRQKAKYLRGGIPLIG